VKPLGINLPTLETIEGTDGLNDSLVESFEDYFDDKNTPLYISVPDSVCKAMSIPKGSHYNTATQQYVSPELMNHCKDMNFKNLEIPDSKDMKALESAKLPPSTQNSWQKLKAWIQVLGGEFRYPIENPSHAEMEKLIAAGLTPLISVEDNLPCYIFEISPEQARYKTSTKYVQCCAFDAAELYLSSLHAIKLHSSDKDWFKSLEVVISSGLPMQHTLTVLHELVKPYGLGISHIIMRKGSSGFEETKLWKQALGCNPMAASSTTNGNKEYLSMLCPEGSDPEYVKSMQEQMKEYKFDYRDDISDYGPCIVFNSTTNQTATVYASGGGHASYRAPRNLSPGFHMALKMDKLENIHYKKNPEGVDYKIGQPVQIPDWRICIAVDGRSFSSIMFNYSSTPHKSSPYSGAYYDDYSSKANPPSHSVVGHKKIEQEKKRTRPTELGSTLDNPKDIKDVMKAMSPQVASSFTLYCKDVFDMKPEDMNFKEGCFDPKIVGETIKELKSIYRTLKLNHALSTVNNFASLEHKPIYNKSFVDAGEALVEFCKYLNDSQVGHYCTALELYTIWSGMKSYHPDMGIFAKWATEQISLMNAEELTPVKV